MYFGYLFYSHTLQQFYATSTSALNDLLHRHNSNKKVHQERDSMEIILERAI
ncbi:MAG: hypothetical protein H7122_17160 [Chitinophagaceae bacterium]|nr:hypothetical protein [Chitinophagaceae bacterium]